MLLPFVNTLLAGLVMTIAGRSQSGSGGLAAENGRRAANWGLTFLMVSTLLWAAHFVAIFVWGRDGSSYARTFFPIGIPLAMLGVLCLVHLGVSIAGGVTAGRRRVFRAPAIGFFRR